jgi:competence protein ComEA
MKKQGITVLLLLTFLFLGFICGFFMGRNVNHSNVELSRLPKPTTAPAPSGTQPVTLPQQIMGKININTATIDQLMLLPGIGQVLAQNIIDYRNTHGNFQKAADLLLVEGIGEQRLDSIIDLITV